MNNKQREELQRISTAIATEPLPNGLLTLTCKIPLKEIKRTVDAILAEPPRNCDIGTADEQYKRHCKWCRKMQDFMCAQSLCRECYAKWSQMPYEEGETDEQK